MAIASSSRIGPPTSAQKLISWKSIASYFGCDERTAKRWERERGLPVHRAPGGKRSAVFAYSWELDSWLKSADRERELDSGGSNTKEAYPDAMAAIAGYDEAPEVWDPREAEPARAEPRTHSRWVVMASAGAGMLALVAVVFWTQRALRPALPHKLMMQGSLASVAHVPAPGAEDLYLQARYLWNLRTADSLLKAMDLYHQAIVKDPAYAEAYAGLAETYDLLPQFGRGKLEEDLGKAEDFADRAIRMDPNIAAAHRAKAFAVFFRDWDISGSDAEFKRALALDPDSAQTHQWYASTLLNRLDGAECVRQIDEALRLDPTSAAIATDDAMMRAEFEVDEKASIAKLEELQRTQPTLLTPSYFLKELDFGRGDYPVYIAELHQLASISHKPDDVALAEAASRGWARAGKVGMLEDIAQVRKAAFDRGTDQGYELAQVYVLMGRPQAALPYFRAALSERFILLIAMEQFDWARKLSAEPGYPAFFAEIRTRMNGGRIAAPRVIPVSFRLPN